jgi:nicotinate dehydrogenase subunit A
MIKLTVNGQEHAVDAEPDTPLLYVLRNDLGLNGAKFGCGLGQCGACTVIVDGAAVFSCLTPIALLPGRQVTTIEGLGTEDAPGPVQRAFMTEQAAQCGYCIAGMVMRAQALLARTPDPSEQEIRDGLNPNLCRCGTHMRILAAVRRAASSLRAAAPTKAAAQ